VRFVRNASIQSKLTITAILTLLFGLSLAGVGYEFYEGASFRSQLLNELEVHAATLGSNIAASLAFDDRKSAIDLLRSLRFDRHIVEACVFDRPGNIFAEYHRDRATALCEMRAPGAEETRFTARGVIFSRIIRLDGENAGSLVLSSDLSELDAKMWKFREVSGLVLILSIMATAIVSYRLVRLVTEPILQLAAVAERVSEREDYAIRAVKVGEDEVGRLVGSFNQMLERIQERDAELQAARDHLETRVEERTQELEKEVIQRGQAEEALSLERGRLRALIDNVPDFAYVKDTDCRFLIANSSVARQMGVQSPEELLGKTDFDFYPRELAETFFKDERRVILTGQPDVNREEIGLDSQGNVSSVLTTQVPLRDKHGRVIGLAGAGSIGAEETSGLQREITVRDVERFSPEGAGA